MSSDTGGFYGERAVGDLVVEVALLLESAGVSSFDQLSDADLDKIKDFICDRWPAGRDALDLFTPFSDDDDERHVLARFKELRPELTPDVALTIGGISAAVSEAERLVARRKADGSKEV